VDDGSGDGAAAMTEAEFPEVGTLSLPAPRGYAAAANAGLARGRAEFVLLLAAYVECTRDPLENLVRPLRHNAWLAAVGPATLQPDGKAMESRASFPSAGSVLSELYERGFPRIPPRVSPGGACDPFTVYIRGDALLFRRKALEDVGALDTQHFYGLEEVDWFRRACVRGWTWEVVPDCRMVRHEDGFGAAWSPEIHARAERNRLRSQLRYLNRHETAPRAQLVRWASVIPLLADVAGRWLRWLVRPGQARRWRARAASGMLRDMVRGRTERW